ncbi:hypothetical protein PIB30_096361 [Stylosanthes scabra]|uniref:Uncharacterized protein n=1 Tax=Stylosanthes scabra TaxID=79078 RepID=A0ABU6YVA3_9FABA|nr:hypothetical protein [Stylosanthes scabra]
MSGYDAEEQIPEDQDNTPLDDVDVSTNPTVNESSQNLANGIQRGGTSIESPGTARITGKKRKQMDILEKMTENVRHSTDAQAKHVQILADTMVGVNEKYNIGEKLDQLGFSEDEVVQVVMKFSDNPNLCSHFWSLTDAQRSALIGTI